MQRSRRGLSSTEEPRILSYDFRSDPILGRAYEYWESKRNGRPMPRRRDIDPSEITRLLPYLQINEFVAGGRIRYRLVGTAIVTTQGFDQTGKFLDEIVSGARRRYFEDSYQQMCREKRPVLMSSRYFSRKDIELIAHRVALPLSEDAATVNQALVAMSFELPGESTSPMPGQWE